jgi:hypothetical protein
LAPIAEKKFKTFFLRDEIKPVLFLYALGLVAATKPLYKRKEKIYLNATTKRPGKRKIIDN